MGRFANVLAIFVLAALGCAQTPLKREFARSILLVQLRVGNAPGWAVIDTGSPWTYVDDDLKADLAGKGSTAKSVETKLWIGGKMTVKHTVRFLDLEPFAKNVAKWPMVAILGRDFLSRYAIGVDHKRNMVKLWKDGKLPIETVRDWAAGKVKGAFSVDLHLDKAPREGSEILALDLTPDKDSGAWTLPGRVGGTGEPLTFNLDTGCSFTSVHWKPLKGLKAVRIEPIADVFGATSRRVVIVPELAMGSLVLKDVEVFADDEGLHPNLFAPKDLGAAWYVLDPAAGKLYVPGD